MATTDTAEHLLNIDSDALRYALPVKEYISEQQNTIQKLNDRVNHLEENYQRCLEKSADMTQSMAEQQTFVNSPYMGVALVLGFILLWKALSKHKVKVGNWLEVEQDDDDSKHKPSTKKKGTTK